MRQLKVIVLGESNVGKSSLLLQLVEQQPPSGTYSTIGVDFHTVTLDYLTGPIHLRIWDTAGQENFRGLVQHYYRQTDVAVLVYDITNWESFTKLDYWLNEIEQYCPDLPKSNILIIGNKTDLVNNRQVLLSEAEAYANRTGIRLIEGNACNYQIVRQMFNQLVRQVQYQPESTPIPVYTSIVSTSGQRNNGQQINGQLKQKCSCQ